MHALLFKQKEKRKKAQLLFLVQQNLSQLLMKTNTIEFKLLRYHASAFLFLRHDK